MLLFIIISIFRWLIVKIMLYAFVKFTIIERKQVSVVSSTSVVNKFYIKEVSLNFNIGLVIHFNIVEL